MTRYFPVPLYLSFPANGTLNQVTQPLVNATDLVEIIMIFPPGTALNLTYQFFFLAGNPTNNTINPGAGEITAQEIQPGLFSGDGVAYTVPFSRKIDRTKQILAMYAVNNTGVAVNAHAIAILAGPD